MVKDGCLEGVDEIYALHVINLLPEGEIRLKEGHCSSGIFKFEIKVKGMGGHGSMPHMSKDVISTTAELLIALN